MTAEEYLKLYDEYKSEKLNRQAELKAIVIEESLPRGIDYSKDRVQSSSGDAMFNIHMRIENRSKELGERILFLTEQMEKIEEAVNSVPDPLSKTLLHRRYIENSQWKPIIKELRRRYPAECGYSDEYIRGKLKRAALEKFAETQKIF